jgi:peptidoglycan hydrolase-like protein with peptidoglycan-binding domain
MYGREPRGKEAHVLHAIAILETGFGRGWRSETGKSSNNLGAIQYRTPKQLGYVPPYPDPSHDGGGFLYTDSSPKSDGSSQRYSVYFRIYPDLPSAAKDLARVGYAIHGRESVRAAAERGDLAGVSAALHRTGYYEGFGKTVADRIANHHKALVRCYAAASIDAQEPAPIESPWADGALRLGEIGPEIAAWQRALNVLIDASIVEDGRFGQATEAATEVAQSAWGITVDGIVGNVSIAAARSVRETIVKSSLVKINSLSANAQAALALTLESNV